MKKMMMTLSFALVATTALAAETFTIETKQVEAFSFEENIEENSTTGGVGPGVGGFNGGFGSSTGGQGSGFSRAGQIIGTAKDLVALGEDIYRLVQKGKPSNTTDFAAVSIVPKDPISKEVVNPFDMENCSFPIQQKYNTQMKSGSSVVVNFEYMVVYTYGCSYDGKGKYIQSAMVQPVSIKTSYGWDFTATMRLNGIMNHGTKENPVVGAMLTIKYSMNSWRTAFEQNDTIHITGAGQTKTYSN